MLRYGTDLTGQTLDIGTDFLGIFAGDFRQLAHFIGDYGEAAPHFPGTCGFDGGVQRQQVGLPGNLLDGLYHRLNTLARLRQVAGAADDLVGLLNHLLDRAGSLLDDLALATDIQAQIVHRAVQFGGALIQLPGYAPALVVGLRQHLAKVGQAREHRANMLIEAVDVHCAAVVLALELVDLLDHHLAQTGELLDLPPQEERLQFAAVGDEVVGVLVVEVIFLTGAKEEHGCQRLVEVQAEDLAEGGKAGHRHIAEHRIHAAQCLLVVEPAQDAVVEDAHQRLARLVPQEALVVAACGLCQWRALDHDQLLARRYVAEQVHALVGKVDPRDGADEHFFAHLNREGVVGQALFQILRCAVERLAECRDHAADIAAGIDHLADVAVFERGAEYAQAERRGLEVLALEHPETDVARAFEKNDQRMVLVGTFAVMQLGLLKIQRAAG